MGAGKKWTPEEEDFLCESWGSKSIPAIAKALNRSVMGVQMRAYRLHLGPMLENGGYMTLNTLVRAIGYGNMDSYKLISWVRKRGLPIHMKRVNDCRFRVVYLQEFWEWAEKNRSFINFAKFPQGALGLEPKWVNVQRRKDTEAGWLQRKDPWTKQEDALLISLVREQKWTYREIAEKLSRTDGAITRRLISLGIKDRPVRMSPRGNPWLEMEKAAVAEGILNGDCYALIGQRVNRSEKAVRGFAYRIWQTEDMDRIREIILAERRELMA